MRRTTRWTALAAAALTAPAGPGRGRAPSACASGAPIVIRYSYDAVRQMSPFDTPALTAAQLEAAKINAAGGVNGSKLVIKTCHTHNRKPDPHKDRAPT